MVAVTPLVAVGAGLAAKGDWTVAVGVGTVMIVAVPAVVWVIEAAVCHLDERDGARRR